MLEFDVIDPTGWCPTNVIPVSGYGIYLLGYQKILLCRAVESLPNGLLYSLL